MQAELIDTGALTRSIEAVLFVASEALSIKALAKLTGAEEADVSLALARIDADYAERGIVLREIAGRLPFRERAGGAQRRRGLPDAAQDQPLAGGARNAGDRRLHAAGHQSAISKASAASARIRCSSTLVDRRFLAEAGRKEVAGRPILYRTTPEFLEAFGLLSLEELAGSRYRFATAPVELVLPIPTQAVPGAEEPKSQVDPAPDAAAGIDPQPEPAEASAADDESENVLAP